MIEQEILHWTHIREASAAGWGGWSDWSDNRLRYLRNFGVAWRQDGRLVGFGGLFWDRGIREAPTACAALEPEFNAHPRSRWVHRAAIEVFEAAREIAPVILARCDPELVSAPRWLRRLGFAPAADGEFWIYAGDHRRRSVARLVHP